ncbi:hypothetical protein KFU94_07340 [Chloroflexi bacterium TSY]|nr:hypothetical protein [Chloroflexi bacterium TSY]
MAQNTKKRQKKLQKKNAKRKQKRSIMARVAHATASLSLNQAKDWPLHEVWVTEDWDVPEELVQIVVARKGPRDFIAVAIVLVDLGCLGVKNADGKITTEYEYQQRQSEMASNQTLIPADLNLVAKIIREGIAYADQFGFKPNRDLGKAMKVIGKADPDAYPEEIPVGGSDGRPFFFAGPYDDSKRIIDKLTNKLGPDGFTYVAPAEAFGDLKVEDVYDFDDDDEDHTIDFDDSRQSNI